jgi:Spx/MgsR family transcriptional regulator
VVTVYGLKNCDTCKKALAWLKNEGLAYRFHDVREDGLDRATLAAWIDEFGWETLLNTRGTTWRGLAGTDTAGLDAGKAAKLILAHPALMKRPLFDLGRHRVLGFKEAEKTAIKGG